MASACATLAAIPANSRGGPRAPALASRHRAYGLGIRLRSPRAPAPKDVGEPQLAHVRDARDKRAGAVGEVGDSRGRLARAWN